VQVHRIWSVNDHTKICEPNSSKQLITKTKKSSLLKVSEERILDLGPRESGELEGEATGSGTRRRVIERKIAQRDDEQKMARALNPHADDGRGYPASWDDLDDRPEWATPTFEVVVESQRQLDWKGLAANDR
jgi:hypothetical protein